MLVSLNKDYINSVQNDDVKRFEEILAPEFYNSNADGTFVDRAGFLKQTAQPVTIEGLKAEDVLIRIFGDFALIHGRTRFTGVDGAPKQGRYTDTYARQNGRWLAVAAHVTRG